MFILEYTIPLLYFIFAGLSVACFFKTKFLNALPLAMQMNILILILCGVFFDSLFIGFIVSIILFVLFFVFYVISHILVHRVNLNDNERIDDGFATKCHWNLTSIAEGILLFIVFYVITSLVNYGKNLTYFDEFSHWGMFIKDSLATDKLYVKSQIPFAHKDYVPASTVFQYIFIKLTGSFKEYHLYEAMQILMFSMIMPIFDTKKIYVSKKNKFFDILLKTILLLIIPSFFDTSHMFYFFRGIYCDFILAITIFYNMYLCYVDIDDNKKNILLTVSLSFLVMLKMIGIIHFVFIIIFYIIIKYAKKDKFNIKNISILIIPLVILMIYTNFTSHIVNIDDLQSFGNKKLLNIFSLIKTADFRTFLSDLFHIYLKSIFTKHILKFGTYFSTFLIITILLVILCKMFRYDTNYRKIKLTSIYIIIMLVLYAIMQFFLYAFEFSDYEALHMASYERYMNTIVLSVFVFLVYIICSVNSKEYVRVDDRFAMKCHVGIMKMLFGFALIHILVIIIGFIILQVNTRILKNKSVPSICTYSVQTLYQYMPGLITDKKVAEPYSFEIANFIKKTINQNEKVFMIIQNDEASYIQRIISYYAYPIICDGNNIGVPPLDIISKNYNYTKEEFLDELSNYDYLFVYNLDDNFKKRYGELFDDYNLLESATLYKVNVSGGKIYVYS